MDQKNVKIYSPDAQIKGSFIGIWKEMISELIASRELIWRLFLRDFLAKYKQAVLGISWAVIMPIIVVGVFVFMNRAGVLNVGKTSIPYPAFALVGLSLWQLFATGLIISTNSIVTGGSMVIKINFPKEALVISSVAQSIFEFLVRIFLIIIVFSYYKIIPAWTVIFIPLAVIPILLFTLAFGLMFSLLNCVARDTANMVTLGTSFLLFITPVLYPAPQSELFLVINSFNPMAFLIDGARELVISGQVNNLSGYSLSVCVSILLFLISWKIFHLVEPRMAERV